MPLRYADPIPWRQVFDDQRRSGLTQAEFCRRLGLPLHAFRKRLYARPSPSLAPEPTAAAPSPTDRPRLVPVTLVADPVAPESAPTADALVLILDGRRRIAVAPGFDAETLRRLVDAIEGRP
ncbi:IS66 family insertion sequence element accessory protein TnpA [Paludisphaera mucosa]|uniref:Transposase n=1 Tax=Paludisphaera mucosa TaxID=3030827 RepID=A0ABT6F6F2_9BACT|nr:hypothetical protein [Paludisphaera mucosa]MDG3003166.1 hypothetical protein [Paludisphaera mucosa]